VSLNDKEEYLKKLRFENGDVIPDVESYFFDDKESDGDD
jgi:hypothetical protein